MSSWDDLAAAEEELRQREQAALSAEPGPDELRALATERDKLAAERDALADSDDEAARLRDEQGLGRDVRGSARDRAARKYAQELDVGAVDVSWQAPTGTSPPVTGRTLATTGVGAPSLVNEQQRIGSARATTATLLPTLLRLPRRR